MAIATVQVEELTGGSAGDPGYYTVKDDTGSANSRYYTADFSGGAATTNPVPIPNESATGMSGSYWKTHCLNVTSPPSVRIENIRYYVDWTTHPSSQWALCGGNTLGDHVIGVSSSTLLDCRTLSQGFVSGSYDVADGSEGFYGNFISGNSNAVDDHQYYAGCTDGHYMSTWNFNTQEDALTIYAGIWSGNSATPARTGRTPCIVTQVLVASGAVQGQKTPVTATFVYDEV